ncbi:unnamed protein product [Effrenium voratum]|nr:unnamed protein product [Effrenium voratum]
MGSSSPGKTGAKYALKTCKRTSTGKMPVEMQTECDILAENDHPFILYMVAVFETKTYVSMLTEILAGGELWSALRKLPVMLPREARGERELWEYKINSMEEVAKHNTKDDCWVVLYGKAYDLSKFAKVHPGGAKLITDAAGMDATKIFDPIHPKDIMDKLLKPALTMGVVDASTIKPEHVAQPPQAHKPAAKKKKAVAAEGQVEEEEEFKKPPLSNMLNTFDFESVAREVMEPQAWGYYSSGGDDEITLRDNHMAFQRITMRPRILVNVREIDMSTTILGVPASLPLYFTATALAKLAHQEGELAIVKAAKKAGVPYMLPTLSSYTLDEMLEARSPDQQVFSQLYVNPERSRSEEYVAKLEAAGVKALFVTVDAPQLGRREKDMRNKFTQQGSDVQGDEEDDGGVDRSQGATRAISSYIDPGLNWEDVPWLKSITKMKVLLKGVQCAEDGVDAFKAMGGTRSMPRTSGGLLGRLWGLLHATSTPPH